MNLLKNKVYLLVYFPIYMLSVLPYFITDMLFGQLLYFISYRVFRYRYHVILQNLSRSLPDKSYLEIQQIARNFYRHLVCMVLEILKLYSINRKDADQKLSVKNKEFLLQYQQQNRNIIVILGHYGNWEYLNALPAILHCEVNAIYKPLSNSVMDQLVRKVRTRFGMKLIPANQALRYLLKQQNNPQLSIFIADQFPGSLEQDKFDFLNQATHMFNGAEKLAIATNAVVVYAEMNKLDNHCWQADFSLITVSPRTTSAQEITKCFADKLQKTIQTAPCYWLWSHKRWKN